MATDKRERRGGATLICYMDNDSINSEVGKEQMRAFTDEGGHRVLYRNPAFYAVSDNNGTLKGEVERIGMKNTLPDGVVIKRGSPNEKIIESSYRAAGVPVEFVEFDVPRPTGNIEPQPGGELLAFLKGMAGAQASGEKAGEPAPATGKGKGDK